MTKEELAYWYWLSDVPGIGSTISRKLLGQFDSPFAVFNASKEHIIARAGIRESLADSIEQAKRNIQKYLSLSENQMKLAESLGAFILTAADKHYSSLYARQFDEQALPPVMHALGDMTLLEGRKVAIVGTRVPSFLGRDKAFNVALNLGQSGFIIVSGLALGIDAEAHKGALKANGKTIAILGCGADVVYPPGNRKLRANILSKGLIMSEFPFGTRPSSENLRKRNRTLIALSESVVVVECPIKSGALIAARFAAQQRKPIFSFHYPETVDNHGGDWLISKSLALELEDITTDSILHATGNYRVNNTVSADKAFLEIWPRKQSKKPRKKTAKKRRIPEKTIRSASGTAAGTLSESSSRQPRLALGDNAVLGEPERIEIQYAFDFAVGDSVVHPTFGKGEIAKIESAGSDYQIIVRFSKRNTRTFSWQFANLRKI